MIVSVPVYLSQQVVFTKVEIQIRTIAMDFWASLEHKMYYKFDGNAPAHIRRELKECADITAFLDRKMLALNEEIQNYKVSADMPDFIENYKSETIEESLGYCGGRRRAGDRIKGTLFSFVCIAARVF